MHCRNCQGPIEEIDTVPDGGYANCPTCGAIQNLAVPDVAPATETLPRGWVALPAKFRLEEEQGSARLRWRWLSRKTFTEAAALVTLPVVYVRYVQPVPGLETAWPFFGIAMAMVLYRVVSQLVNHTSIEVRRGEIRVQHGPLPWPRTRTIPTGNIEQLFCSEQRDPRHVNRRLGYFDVQVTLKEGQGVVDLVTRLPEAKQALFIEQLIERVLRIEDRAVSGELPRDG